ncbi:MAG: carboxypeptidase-like regulatory domain-containing protein, partial [Sphingobacteriales bacterium]|nr:carboxypeptidase-like regulatory domain-containing protein [Sphingobacteriales bacterium]
MKNFIASSFKSLLVLLLAATALWSCQKDLDETLVDNINQIPNLTTKINSSVSGFVVDENNQAVAGASVVVYDKTTTTDDYGYFSVKNVNVVKTAAVVTINKSGYFPGIKTYIATENKSAFFRIKLIPKLNSGSFNGLNGGTITLTNGMKIDFPVNGIQDLLSSNSNPYSGTVYVSASYIDPTASDINSIMPGDLRGINEEGSMQVLQSFGMVAVKLTGDQGQALQIASGKKATLTFPIPSALSSTAPTSIPLWYFDESNGLWKEEGSATKVGNNYVGDVAHFSFWNCDVPSNFVQFNCTLVNEAGAPIPYTWVKITNVNFPQSYRYGLTDSSGFVAGAVPNNASLKLDVYTQFDCGTAAFTQTFSTTSSNVSLGNLTIPNTTA